MIRRTRLYSRLCRLSALIPAVLLAGCGPDSDEVDAELFDVMHEASRPARLRGGLEAPFQQAVTAQR